MKKKKNVKRIAALTAVVLLVGLYVATLLTAIFDTTAAGSLFRVCLLCTVAIPLLAWIFIWIYGQTAGKDTIADRKIILTRKDLTGNGSARSLPVLYSEIQCRGCQAPPRL